MSDQQQPQEEQPTTPQPVVEEVPPVSETTPLLPNPDRRTEQSPPPSEPFSPLQRPRDILLLSWASVVSSVVILTTYATYLVFSLLVYENWDWLHYRTQGAAAVLSIMAIVALVFSAFNLQSLYKSNRPLWLGPNVFVDMLLVFFIGPYTLEGANFLSTSCRDGGYYRPQPPPDCDAVTLRFFIILCFLLAFSAALGIVHLVLAVKRWIEVFKSGNRSRNEHGRTWAFPTGQLTFEFTVKLLRQENSVQGPTANV